MKTVHEYIDYPFTFRLYEDGRFTVQNRIKGGPEIERPWYKNKKGKPWMVKKAKTFKSLVKQNMREGDYADLLDKH